MRADPVSDKFLFVYGKLRKDNVNPYAAFLKRNSQFVGEGWMSGKLYDVGNYPGAVQSNSPDEKIIGELYKLNVPYMIFNILDDFEECSDKYLKPHEYRRTIVKTYLYAGESMPAYAYIYNRDVNSLQPIPSGNYLHYIFNTAC